MLAPRLMKWDFLHESLHFFYFPHPWSNKGLTSLLQRISIQIGLVYTTLLVNSPRWEGSKAGKPLPVEIKNGSKRSCAWLHSAHSAATAQKLQLTQWCLEKALLYMSPDLLDWTSVQSSRNLGLRRAAVRDPEKIVSPWRPRPRSSALVCSYVPMRKLDVKKAVKKNVPLKHGALQMPWTPRKWNWIGSHQSGGKNDETEAGGTLGTSWAQKTFWKRQCC